MTDLQAAIDARHPDQYQIDLMRQFCRRMMPELEVLIKARGKCVEKGYCFELEKEDDDYFDKEIFDFLIVASNFTLRTKRNLESTTPAGERR